MPFYGSSPKEIFFEKLDDVFALHDTSLEDKFKIAWFRLTEKAKSWAKLNITSSVMSTYAKLKEILILAFPAEMLVSKFTS